MRTLLVILIVVLSAANAFATQDTSAYFQFNMDNGFPSNNVYSVIQDRDGYLWFATDNGVVKYNGYQFKIFNTSNGLPVNDVWELFSDSKDRIWIGAHMNQIGYIKNNKYYTAATAAKTFRLSCISEYKGVIAACVGRSIFINIDTLSGFFDIKKTFFVGPSPDLKFWLTKRNTSLLKYDLLSRKSIKLLDKIKATEWRWEWYIGSDHFFYSDNSCVGFRHGDKHLTIINLDSFSEKKINITDLGGWGNEWVYTVWFDGNVIRIISNKAIYSLATNLVTYTRTPFAFISASQLAFYFPDNFKDEWFCTTKEGVKYSLRSSCRFQIAEHLLIGQTGVHIISVSEDGTTYWEDKNKHTILKMDISGHLVKEKIRGVSFYYSATQRNDSETFVSTDNGIYVVNMGKGTAYNFANEFNRVIIQGQQNAGPDEYDTVASVDLKKYARIDNIGNDKLLALNYEAHILEFKNGFLKDTTIDQNHFDNYCYDTVNKLIWLYNPSRLVAYDIIKNKTSVFLSDGTSKFGLKTITDVKFDKYGDVYIVDNDKIVIYCPAKQRAISIKCPFNLLNGHLMIYDDMLFIAGRFGVAYANINGSMSLGNFHITSNSKERYYNQVYNFFAGQEGSFYINTDKGFYTINIKDLVSSRGLFSSADSNFMRLELTYPYQHGLDRGDTVILKPREQKIGLDVINFLGNGTVQYSYKVAGITTDWQQSTSGEIFTGSLKPDEYYKVSCIARDDTWISGTKVFYVYVTPYWYQRHTWRTIFWISGVIALVVLILMVALITRFFVQRSNEKKRMLTELELRAVYAQINPHFIFNTLSSALYYISRKRFDDAYMHVNKFSRLLRSYLKSSQDRYITLGEEIDMLRNYIELQKTRFEEKFAYEIVVDNKLAVKNIQLPSLLLQPLVENAINHGLFHRGGGGFLSLRFEQGANSEELICTIEDNGVGRERSKEIKKESSTQRESYGTKLTQQLIDIFKEFEHMDIELEYKDKEYPETGTIVRLTIKNLKYVT